MAVTLSAVMFFMNNQFLTDAFAKKKTTEITKKINSSIASMIIDKQSDLLSNSIKDMEFLLSSKASLFLNGKLESFEIEMLNLYDESFAKDIDVFFFQSVDGQYIFFNASSPFYDTSRIITYMMANSRFLQHGTKVIQSESTDGTLIALSGSSEVISDETGELAGYFYAGILLNNSSNIIADILAATNLSEAAIIYGDSIISGETDKEINAIIGLCYNQDNISITKGEVAHCSDITLEDSGVTLKFFQSLPDTFVENIRRQNKKKIIFAVISIVFLVTILLGYIVNLFTVRSLYRLVDFTKAILSSNESIHYKQSIIFEFNLLAEHISNITDDLTETQIYLKNLITHAEAPISIWDENGNIALFNSSLEKLSGLESSNVVGKHLSHIYHIFPDAKVSVANNAGSHVSTSKFESAVTNMQTEVTKHVIWNLTDIYTDNKYLGTIIQGIDITERKDSEAKLLLASKVFFENTLDGIIIIDDKGTIISTNTSYTAMTGFKEDDVRGRSVMILRSDKHDTVFFIKTCGKLCTNTADGTVKRGSSQKTELLFRQYSPCHA